ncbi:hypothetical protein N9064_00730 [bacterium]|nr:hypothetical protein [bacterium]
MSSKYIKYSTYSYALEKSQEQAIALGCDGIHTSQWWAVLEGANGEGYLVIPEAEHKLPEISEEDNTTSPYIDPLTAWQRRNLINKEDLNLPKEEEESSSTS